MSECREFKELMIEARYGELGPADRERFDRHVASCPACAAEYASLRATLELMDERRRPEPGPEFWSGYWERLSRRMLWEAIEEGRRPSLAGRLAGALDRLPRWSLQAAGAAALLLIGVFIGGRLIAPPGGPVRETAAVAAPAPAVVQAQNFIERSKVLLLGLVNYQPGTQDAYALDLERKRAMSRDLAAEAPNLRRALSARDQKRLRGLVADLEVIMMQIANLGSGQDVEGIDLVKRGVDERGIFLKIDLDRLGREARSTAPAQAGANVPRKSKA
jgi:hypothetical protein